MYIGRYYKHKERRNRNTARTDRENKCFVWGKKVSVREKNGSEWKSKKKVFFRFFVFVSRSVIFSKKSKQEDQKNMSWKLDDLIIYYSMLTWCSKKRHRKIFQVSLMYSFSLFCWFLTHKKRKITKCRQHTKFLCV